MSKYIKSHSNFVIKSKHQDLQSSTIWERDITTIGGVDQYAKGQTPIYRSGNFIITVNNESSFGRDISRSKWESNSSSGETWTQEVINSITSGETLDDETDLIIKPKQDYYDLRSFAYYGSCAELIRGSINGIIQDFPGELYCVSASSESGESIMYADYSSGFGDNATYKYFSGNTGELLYWIHNPFFIDIDSLNIDDISSDDTLKYFCNEGYKDYEVIDALGNIKEITQWESVPNESYSACPGQKMGEVHLYLGEEKKDVIKIESYMGNNKEILYFVDKDNYKNLAGCHIRPKYKYFIQYYNSLSTFQKLLLNLDSTPKYKATFRIICENSYGYYTKMQSFVFPTDAGDYNLSTTVEEYSNYIQSLALIGSFYDERFSDNLWRSMTHEAIKNFDWSYKREYADGDDEDYIAGGNKIQKMIHILGMEFDESKAYIDSIQNTNTLSYSERSNMPDYFLTDALESDGWDYHSVYPISAIGEDVSSITFTQLTDDSVQPYWSATVSATSNGYFPHCREDWCDIDWMTEPYSSSTSATTSGKFLNTIKPYSDKADYSYRKINKEFAKRLKLNSRNILRHKGTIEGIEMMLGMFGLKSKRWVERTADSCLCGISGNSYDYEVREYTSFIKSPIEEKWDKLNNEYRIDWVNSTKLISYTYENDGTDYVKYQGIPLSYRTFGGEHNILKIDKKEVKDNDGNYVQKRWLYPYFNSSEQLDGNPYYQMNGGWESKKFNGIYFQFDKDDVFHSGSTGALYHETLRSIHSVNTIQDLLNIPQENLHDDEICYVYNLDDYVCAIDGKLYDIQTDEYCTDKCIGYVDFPVINGTVYAGSKEFNDSVTVYDYQGNGQTYNLEYFSDNYCIKSYIWKDKYPQLLLQTTVDDSISSFGIADYLSDSANTHFFYLESINDFDKLDIDGSNQGWRILKNTEDLYSKANLSFDYLKGNNPHSGEYLYDAGYEYMHYFDRIFNHALDNELFDERCYGRDYDYSTTVEIPSYGFSGLTSGTSVVDNIDSKIHFFGNYVTPTRTTDIDEFDLPEDRISAITATSGYPFPISALSVYSDDAEILQIYNESGRTYSKIVEEAYNNEFISALTTYSIGNVMATPNSTGSVYSGGAVVDTYSYSKDKPEGDWTLSGSTDQTTDQIVNNKHISLIMYLPISSGDTIETQMQCLKYYDSVITPYVEQMIPSTAIFDIGYKYYDNKGGNTITWLDSPLGAWRKTQFVSEGKNIGTPPTPPEHIGYTFTKEWEQL